MAEVRTSYPVLEDATSGAGLALHKVAEGDLIANKNALAALVAKDPDDKFRYLSVDADGHLITTDVKDVAILSDKGTNGGDKTQFVDVVTITLSTEKTYKTIDLVCSCFRDTMFKIVQKNDTTETTLVEPFRVGSGNFSFEHLFEKITFVTGATGDQELILKGQNLDVAATMSGFMGTDEVQ